jgi:hypothetical protein
VSRIPLNPQGGEAAVIKARATDADLDRLNELARCLGVPVSQVIRVCVGRGLDALEREQPPPDDGG